MIHSLYIPNLVEAFKWFHPRPGVDHWKATGMTCPGRGEEKKNVHQWGQAHLAFVAQLFTFVGVEKGRYQVSSRYHWKRGQTKL